MEKNQNGELKEEKFQKMMMMILVVMMMMLISTSGLHDVDDGVMISSNLRSQRFSQVWAATGLGGSRGRGRGSAERVRGERLRSGEG